MLLIEGRGDDLVLAGGEMNGKFRLMIILDTGKMWKIMGIGDWSQISIDTDLGTTAKEQGRWSKFDLRCFSGVYGYDVCYVERVRRRRIHCHFVTRKFEEKYYCIPYDAMRLYNCSTDEVKKIWKGIIKREKSEYRLNKSLKKGTGHCGRLINGMLPAMRIVNILSFVPPVEQSTGAIIQLFSCVYNIQQVLSALLILLKESAWYHEYGPDKFIEPVIFLRRFL